MQPITPYVCRSSEIQDISDSLDVQLKVGPSSRTYHKLPAQSVSNSAVSWSATPSEGVAVGRDITMSARVALRLTVTGVDQGDRMFHYSVTDCLGQLPLNNLITNATLRINSSSMTVPIQDIHAVLAQMTPDESYLGNSPVMADRRFRDYNQIMADSVGSVFNPYGEYTGAGVPGRGSHPLVSIAYRRTGIGLGAGIVANQFSSPNSIAVACTSNDDEDVLTVDIVFDVVEPVCWLSPLLYTKSNNNSAFTGVRSIDLQLSLDPTAKRSFSSAGAGSMTCALVSLTNPTLNLEYINSDQLALLGRRSVYPLTEWSRYLTTNQNVLAGGSSTSAITQMITLSKIPSKIYVAVRYALNQTSVRDSNCFWPVSKLSVDFNNRSNILASMNANDLYDMSARNGSRQSRYEFLGRAGAGDGISVATIGGVVVIDPSQDLQLPANLSCGSLGNFQLQMNVTFENTGETGTPEIIVVCQHDGIFVCEAGISTAHTGLFNSDMVVKAVTAQHGQSLNYIKSFEHSIADASTAGLKNIAILSKTGIKSVSGGVMSGAGAGRVC